MEHLLHLLLLLIISIGSFFVLFSKNPVQSVLFLILVFVCGAGLLMSIGAEFISLIFIIVYVGVIAVLFLFIVMMLDVKLNQTDMVMQYIPFGFIFGLIFIFELYLSFETVFVPLNFKNTTEYWYKLIDNLSNIELLGQVLYQEFIICFLLCGILLLIAMLGAIILTQKVASQRTNEIVARQLSRGAVGFYNLKT